MTSPPTAAGSTAPAGASRKWLVAASVMLGATLEVLDTAIVNVSLPHLQGSFSASADEITWVLTSYLAANGVMIPLTGWISARFGRKRYFLTSVALFVVASGMCGAAESLRQLVLFRLLQGAAGAAMIPSSQAILMETFPPEEQGLAMATWGIGLMTAPMLGPTLGGWITENWNWRWNFYINVPLGILAAAMVMVFVHDPDYLQAVRRGARRVDVLGIVFLVLGIGLLQIVLDRGQRADWFAAPWVCAFTAISAVSLVLLVIHELRFPEPILDLDILRIPTFNVAVAIVTAMVMIVFGTNLLNPLFLQQLMGYTAWNAGLAVLPRGFGVFFGMIAVGQLSKRGFDTRYLIGVGFAFFAVSLWSMSHWTLDVGTNELTVPIVLSGVGSGLIFPTLSATTLACVARERMGYAASLYNTVRNTGSALGISIVTNLLASRQQVHQAILGQHFTAYEAWKLDHPARTLPGAPHWELYHGLATDQLQGFAVVYRAIQREAALMAYNDLYWILAVIGLLFVPSFLLLRRTRTTAGAPVH